VLGYTLRMTLKRHFPDSLPVDDPLELEKYPLAVVSTGKSGPVYHPARTQTEAEESKRYLENMVTKPTVTIISGAEAARLVRERDEREAKEIEAEKG
jgi:hypothetical protein